MTPASFRLVSTDRGVAKRRGSRLGELLLEQGEIDLGELERALASQKESQQKLGDILVSQGALSAHVLCQALAAQWGLATVDLEAEPPDTSLFDEIDLDTCIEHQIIPWRSIGGLTAYVAADPDRAPDALAALSSAPVAAFVLLSPRSQIERALVHGFSETFAKRAAAKSPASMSVRSLAPGRRAFALVLAAGALSLAVGGASAAVVGLAFLFLLNLGTTLLRIVAVWASQDDLPHAQVTSGALDFVGKRPPPIVTLLLPLYRESGMISGLIEMLEAIDYPPELLDVLLLVEECDGDTRDTLGRHDLPPWVRVIVVPGGSPRTKPRALNHAFEFCRGEIIGILDAEDHPAPDQIRTVVDVIRKAPPDVACVQCQLGYFNDRQNWLSRCFQLEYAIWFDVLLRGFQCLRLPIPLGGTSVYLRRSALREVGAWDAHNVTEDADLGMRLARSGFRCLVSRSLTLEEANCRVLPWIRQRSRWLKGYLLTWLSHMRAPVQLWRDIGMRGFIGLNLLFLGAAATYLAAPLFWIAIICWVTTGETVWSEAVPGWAVWPAGVSLAVGQITMLACAALAMRRRKTLDMVLWVPTLPLYWTLGAIAAWKAVFELIFAPYYWDKTEHGFFRFPAEK